MLPIDFTYRGCAWQWLDLILEGHVAPRELVLHVVVAEDIDPRCLVPLDVDAHVLPLHVGIVVAVLVLAQRPLEFDVVGALECWCLEVD